MQLLFVLVLLVLATQAFSATNSILPLGKFETADIDTLKREADLFNAIGQGVKLSLAQCEITNVCLLSAGSTAEMASLINTLNLRIEKLVELKQSDENAEQLEPLITAYASHRDTYSDYLQQLEAYIKELEQSELSEEELEFLSQYEAAVTAELLEYEGQITDDEELLDDETLVNDKAGEAGL